MTAVAAGAVLLIACANVASLLLAPRCIKLWNVGWRASFPLWIKNFPWEMHDFLFWAGMTVIVFLSLVLKPKGDDGAGGLAALLDEPTSPNGKADSRKSDPSTIA